MGTKKHWLCELLGHKFKYLKPWFVCERCGHHVHNPYPPQGNIPPPGVTVPAAHAPSHKDGGADELDASELAGALGAPNQILQTDGAALSWVDPPAAGGDSFLVVAAADTPATLKARADYVGDGAHDMGDVAGDEAEINAALGAADTVILCPGTYWINNPIVMASNKTLIGGGAGSVIKIRDSKNVDFDMIANPDIVAGNDHIVVKNLKLDGNKANQTAGLMHGINFIRVAPYGSTPGCKIEGCFVENLRAYGIYMRTSSRNNTITGNTVQGNGFDGIHLTTFWNGTVIGNTCKGNDRHGIALDASFNTAVSGNICQSNGNHGIWSHASKNNTVSGNTVQGNSQDTDATYDGLFLDASDYNLIEGNLCRMADVSTTLTGAHSAGVTAITLASTTGFWVGGGITFDPGGVNEETKKIESITDATHLVITAGLTSDQANGEEVIAPRTQYGINVSNDACDRNCLIGNDLYDSGSTGDLNDVPTTNPTLKHDNRNLAGTGWLAEV